MTEYPSRSNKGNGIGLGNGNMARHEYMLTPQLKSLKTCVEQTVYKGVDPGFDNSLEEWGDQGVLCLNSALTCTSVDSKEHVKHWEVFMKQFITQASDNNTNLVFAFVGDACKYAKYVNTEFHKVVEEPESIEECLKTSNIWMSDIFNTINDELFHLSGDKNNLIEW
jgi:uracil DNA glycosylase